MIDRDPGAADSAASTGRHRRHGEPDYRPGPAPGLNGHLRWIVVGVLLALGAAFTGAYNFLSSQFASKAEVDIIRQEQQRRTQTVYAIPNRVDEFGRQLDLLRSDIRRLEETVAELRLTILQGRPPDPTPRRRWVEPERPPPPTPSGSRGGSLTPPPPPARPTWPASGAPASGQP